jgi:hypothetical protein
MYRGRHLKNFLRFVPRKETTFASNNMIDLGNKAQARLHQTQRAKAKLRTRFATRRD